MLVDILYPDSEEEAKKRAAMTSTPIPASQHVIQRRRPRTVKRYLLAWGRWWWRQLRRRSRPDR